MDLTLALTPREIPTSITTGLDLANTRVGSRAEAAASLLAEQAFEDLNSLRSESCALTPCVIVQQRRRTVWAEWRHG
jgi:hypothetical protein